MIGQNDQNIQLPKELKSAFGELGIFKHLHKAGITKKFGFKCSYLFQLVFCLIFHHKSWFTLLQSKKGESSPAKDAVYCFLNHSKFNWRRFLTLLSASTIGKVDALTDSKRPKVLIVDDSMYDRDRSKKLELLARCMDHSSMKKRYYKGFRMLTLGWSDGFTFMPLDFTLLSSIKAQINGISENIDKRCSGYKRRLDALQTAPEQVTSMVKRALSAGVSAHYLLMDSWFTHQPFITSIVELGLDVIGMVKPTNQRYLVENKQVSLKHLYFLATPVQGRKGILRSIYTILSNGTPVKIVFIQNRNKRSEWLAILSTDCTITEREIVRIYGMRWDIEVFFKTTKSLLRLQKEFQGLSYDLLISHTTLVFSRYIVLSWQNRCNTDQRTLGGIFYELCDEVNELDWAVALQQLIELLDDVLKKSSQAESKHWASYLSWLF
ncbi:transposase [Siminovitchia sp. 179-K 8D1 HS]|uniref:IS4 family transposase n=1 Tax=Siminovitchia sp. 179-K 8D1 HS TaxID=3142385 RepID=UPI0039A12448